MSAKMRLIYILILMIFHAQKGWTMYDCIKHCTCEKQQGEVTADCIASNFTEVPYPNPPNQIHILYLQFNFITVLRDDDFAIFDELRLLNLSGNRLTTIERNAFYGLSRLESLDLSSNMLTSIPDNAWAAIEGKLTWLSLSLNAFFKLPNGITNLTSLTHLDASQLPLMTDITSPRLPASLVTLDLRFSGIKRFLKSSLGHLANLTKLILADNTVASFEPGLFNELTSLEHLDLSRMYCRNLPRDSFAKLRHLKSLSLSNCFLKTPPSMSEVDGGGTNFTATTRPPGKTIWFNPYLEQLDLSNNKLDLDPKEKVFPPTLTELRLDYTHIHEIDDNTFGESDALRILNMSHGRLQSVSPDAFTHFQNMTVLDLSGNQLTHLPRLPSELKLAYLGGSYVNNITRNLLQDLEDITEFSLANGQIMMIEDKSFANMTKMETLDISDNKLNSLKKDTLFISKLNKDGNSLKILDLSSNIIDTIEEDAFLSLDHLEALDLQMNSLIVIEQRAFVGLKRLVTLNLNSNSLSVIDPNALDPLESIESLNLDDNELTFLTSEVFSKAIHLKKLILSSNNLLSMIPLNLPALQYLDLSKNNLTTFPAVSGKSLEYVSARGNFLTDFDSGAFREAARLRELDLSESTFTRFNYSILRDCESLEVLKLQENMITNFVDTKFLNLKKLVMSFNEISSIPNRLDSILPHLVELHMNSNNVANINPDIFSNVTLRYLDLSFNPFHCDCKLIPFTNWMNTHENILVGRNTWSCGSPEEFQHEAITEAVGELTNCNQLQTQKPSLIMIAITAVVATLFLAFSIYVITICVKSRRKNTTQQEHTGGNEVRVSSGGRSWFTNCYRRISYDDESNLVSTVSSPSQKEAPTSL